MGLLREEITEDFLERLVDDVVARLGEKFNELNISLKDIDLSIEFLGAITGDVDPTYVSALQKTRHRISRPARKSAPESD